MTVSVWRIAQDTKSYEAHDLSGKGAENTGGRWNDKGTPLVYSSTTRALAVLETVVHLNAGGLPLNRYLVEIIFPEALWNAAQQIDASTAPVGWDAQPSSRTASDFGTNWASSNTSLLLIVPSVVVPDESNLLINPRHPGMSKLSARKVCKWLYDPRLERP